MAGQVVPAGRQYATRVEVEEGLKSLTPTDHAKLMMIARVFCRRRRLSSSVMEPEELLSEAVLKSLQCEEEGKRWNKSISLVRHLDRAMENISGHLVKKQARVVSFADGLHPDDDQVSEEAAEDILTESEGLASRLKSIFGDDLQASLVFQKRMQELRPNEIQLALSLSPKDYETINRRILRKITLYQKKTTD